MVLPLWLLIFSLSTIPYPNLGLNNSLDVSSCLPPCIFDLIDIVENVRGVQYSMPPPVRLTVSALDVSV
jgi:hypothetical protein